MRFSSLINPDFNNLRIVCDNVGCKMDYLSAYSKSFSLRLLNSKLHNEDWGLSFVWRIKFERKKFIRI